MTLFRCVQQGAVALDTMLTPDVCSTGFGVSGASGSGVVVARLPDGSWSPPSGLLVHTIGFGWLIGLDVVSQHALFASQCVR